MRKLHIFLIILFAVLPLALMGTYVLYEPSRITLEGIFMPLIGGATPTIMSLRSSFMALPYWQWIGVGIVVVVTLIFDRKMHLVWDLWQWGKRGDPRKLFNTGPPKSQPPLSIPTQQNETPSLEPPLAELEVKQE